MDVSAQGTHHIHEFQLPQPFVHVGAFLGQEAGVLLVGFRVLDVERRVRDVEIAAQYRLLAAVRRFIAQLPHTYQHGVEETVFLLHFLRIVGVAGVHVHAYDSDGVPLRGLHIRFDPTAGIDVLLKSRQSVAFVDDGQRGEQTDAGASLDTADLVHAIKPALVGDASGGRVFEAEFVEDGVDFVLRGAYFLHAPHVRRVLRGPLLDAFAFRRADSIHIRCRDCDRHSALA